MKNNGTSITITAISGRRRIKRHSSVPGAFCIYWKRLLGLLREIENQYQEQLDLPKRYHARIKIIRKVLKQQQEMFETGESVPDRIVSISKSYIRPIVRGKEVKAVEFGAKVNMIQFDGINFIEHLSFNAFNEGTRLVKSIRYGRSLVWQDHSYIS